MVMASVWMAESPPAISRAAAMNAVAIAKKMRTVTLGFTSPPVASMPITREPESEDVTKNTADRRMKPIIIMTPPGSCSITWKRAVLASIAPSGPTTER